MASDEEYFSVNDKKCQNNETGNIKVEMGQEEINEIKRIDSEIHRLEIVAENVYNQIKALKERKKFYEMLPN